MHLSSPFMHLGSRFANLGNRFVNVGNRLANLGSMFGFLGTASGSLVMRKPSSLSSPRTLPDMHEQVTDSKAAHGALNTLLNDPKFFLGRESPQLATRTDLRRAGVPNLGDPYSFFLTTSGKFSAPKSARGSQQRNLGSLGGDSDVLLASLASVLCRFVCGRPCSVVNAVAPVAAA